MKKRIAAVFLIMALLGGFGVGLRYYRLTHKVSGLQLMQIMVDGRKYFHYGVTTDKIPNRQADGTVRRVNEKTDYPDEDGEANFGIVGMPYWHTEDGIVVHAAQTYYVFE